MLPESSLQRSEGGGGPSKGADRFFYTGWMYRCTRAAIRQGSQARHNLPAGQKCYGGEQAKGATHEGASGNPKLLIGGQGALPALLTGRAMGLLKGEHFGKDGLLKPRMAVAKDEKVAAPAEKATNVVATEAQWKD